MLSLFSAVFGFPPSLVASGIVKLHLDEVPHLDLTRVVHNVLVVRQTVASALSGLRLELAGLNTNIVVNDHIALLVGVRESETLGRVLASLLRVGLGMVVRLFNLKHVSERHLAQQHQSRVVARPGEAIIGRFRNTIREIGTLVKHITGHRRFWGSYYMEYKKQ